MHLLLRDLFKALYELLWRKSQTGKGERREKERTVEKKKENSPAHGGNRILDLTFSRRVFYRCAIIAYLHIPTDGVARIFYKLPTTVCRL